VRKGGRAGDSGDGVEWVERLKGGEGVGRV